MRSVALRLISSNRETNTKKYKTHYDRGDGPQPQYLHVFTKEIRPYGNYQF